MKPGATLANGQIVPDGSVVEIPLQPVAVTGLAPGQALHQLPDTLGVTRCQQQVNMVCHQAICVDLDAKYILNSAKVSR